MKGAVSQPNVFVVNAALVSVVGPGFLLGHEFLLHGRAGRYSSSWEVDSKESGKMFAWA